jgi:hypothetical protein
VRLSRKKRAKFSWRLRSTQPENTPPALLGNVAKTNIKPSARISCHGKTIGHDHNRVKYANPVDCAAQVFHRKAAKMGKILDTSFVAVPQDQLAVSSLASEFSKFDAPTAAANDGQDVLLRHRSR